MIGDAGAGLWIHAKVGSYNVFWWLKLFLKHFLGRVC